MSDTQSPSQPPQPLQPSQPSQSPQSPQSLQLLGPDDLSAQMCYPIISAEQRRAAGYRDPPSFPMTFDNENLIECPEHIKHLVRPRITLTSRLPLPKVQPIPKSYVKGGKIKIFSYLGQDLLTGEATEYKSAKQALMDLPIVKQYGIEITDDMITINDRNGSDLKRYLEDDVGLTCVKRFSIQSGVIGGGLDSHGYPMLIIMGRCNNSGQPGFLHAIIGYQRVVDNKLDSETEIVPYREPEPEPESESESESEPESEPEPEPESEPDEPDLSTIYNDLVTVGRDCVVTCMHLGKYTINKVRGVTRFVTNKLRPSTT